MSINIGLDSTLGNNRDSYSAIISSAEAMIASESFNSSFRNVLDLFIRTGNVLKVTVTRFNRSLKRGEMEKYVNDHTLIVKSIDNLNYFEVKDMYVDVPFGMQCKYMEGISVLNYTLKNLDTAAMMNAAISAFKYIRTTALRNEDVASKVEDIHSTLAVKTDFVEKQAKEIAKLFTTKDRKNVKFGDVFESMADFKDVKIATIDGEKYLSQADKLSKQATELSGIISDITALNDKQISKQVSDSLSESAMMLAKMLDLYGTCSLNEMAVSHNLTLVYNTLYTKVK